MNALHPSWGTTPAAIRLAMAAASSARPIREAAFMVINGVQRVPASQQIEAVFAAAVIMANATGLDAHELVSRAKRQIPDLEFSESAIGAISDYVKGELR